MEAILVLGVAESFKESTGGFFSGCIQAASAFCCQWHGESLEIMRRNSKSLPL